MYNKALYGITGANGQSARKHVVLICAEDHERVPPVLTEIAGHCPDNYEDATHRSVPVRQLGLIKLNPTISYKVDVV